MSISQHRYKFTGPGITRALQKATDEQKDIVLVYAKNENGQPVKVGFFLVAKGEPTPTKPNITPFNSNEIEVSLDNTQEDFKQLVLGAEFIHPRDKERHFLFNLPIDPNCRFVLRNLFRLTDNSVTGWVIQIEIILDMKGKKSKSRPVIRYDQSHGFIHRDMININGSKNKHKIMTKDTKTAIILAIDEIRDNLNSWLKQLGYSPYGQQILNLPFIVQEMDKVKEKLIELHDHPENMKDFKSSYLHLQDGPDLTGNC